MFRLEVIYYNRKIVRKKHIKVSLTETNFDFCGTNFDFFNLDFDNV